MKKLYLLVIALFALCSVNVLAAESATEVLDQAVAKIKKASSVNCRFSVKADNQSVAGSLNMAGNKFKLETPHATTWFDGAKMWTANPKTKEITLVNPTDRELKESNPLQYLQGYKKDYKVFFSKRKDTRRYLVLLNPKSKNSDIKAVEIALNKITLLPERLIIRDKNDKRTTVIISAMTVESKVDPKDYVCPVQSMTDYEVVDLR